MAYEAANSYTMAIRVMEFSNFKNSIFASYLLRLPISPILKIQKFHLGILNIDSQAKIFLNLYNQFDNSTTRIAISYK